MQCIIGVQDHRGEVYQFSLDNGEHMYGITNDTKCSTLLRCAHRLCPALVLQFCDSFQMLVLRTQRESHWIVPSVLIDLLHIVRRVKVVIYLRHFAYYLRVVFLWGSCY